MSVILALVSTSYSVCLPCPLLCHSASSCDLCIRGESLLTPGLPLPSNFLASRPLPPVSLLNGHATLCVALPYRRTTLYLFFYFVFFYNCTFAFFHFFTSDSFFFCTSSTPFHACLLHYTSCYFSHFVFHFRCLPLHLMSPLSHSPPSFLSFLTLCFLSLPWVSSPITSFSYHPECFVGSFSFVTLPGDLCDYHLLLRHIHSASSCRVLSPSACWYSPALTALLLSVGSRASFVLLCGGFAPGRRRFVSPWEPEPSHTLSSEYGSGRPWPYPALWRLLSPRHFRRRLVAQFSGPTLSATAAFFWYFSFLVFLLSTTASAHFHPT